MQEETENVVEVMVIDFDHQCGIFLVHSQIADDVDLEEYSRRKLI